MKELVCVHARMHAPTHTHAYTHTHTQGGWGLRLFFSKIERSCRKVEIYKWKWMVLGALGCLNNVDFEKLK